MTRKRLNNPLKTFKDEISGSISGTNEFHVFNVPVQNISGSPVDIKWSNVVIKDDIFSFVPGSSDVVVNKDGWFKVNVELTFNTNSNRTGQGLSQIKLNGSTVDGTLMYSYHNNNSAGAMTVTCTRVIDISSGDIVSICAEKTSGGNLKTITQGCRMTIEEIV